MVVTVFRSRVKPEALQDYMQWASRMGELARRIPGYISHKGFTADDGERVTIVEFESEEAQHAWAMHPDHVEARCKGRKDFYSAFRVQICIQQRRSVYPNVAAVRVASA